MVKSLVPLSLLALLIGVHFLEPWLVTKAKHWIAHNPKKLLILTLGGELLINNGVLIVLYQKHLLAGSPTVLQLIYLACNVFSWALLGVCLRQQIDPLKPGYFMDRVKLKPTVAFLGLALGCLSAVVQPTINSTDFES